MHLLFRTSTLVIQLIVLNCSELESPRTQTTIPTTRCQSRSENFNINRSPPTTKVPSITTTRTITSREEATSSWPDYQKVSMKIRTCRTGHRTGSASSPNGARRLATKLKTTTTMFGWDFSRQSPPPQFGRLQTIIINSTIDNSSSSSRSVIPTPLRLQLRRRAFFPQPMSLHRPPPRRRRRRLISSTATATRAASWAAAAC